MALTQKLDLRPKLVSFEGDQTVKEREEREKKKKGGGVQEGFKGMELLTLSMDPWFCLVNGYLLYPNLGFVRISS